MDEIINLIGEIKPYCTISPETNLIVDGVLDSMEIIVLISMLEGHFDITIPDDSVIVENFSTVDSIYNMINKICNG